MRTILVGSAATRAWRPDFRVPSDLDYFTDKDMPKELNGKRVEKFYHPDLEKWFWAEEKPMPKVLDGGKVGDPKTRATLNELYTLKVSHMFWPNRWVKHAKDILWFQNETDAQFLPELYDILYPIWVEHYGKKRASLPKGTKAEDFFKSNIVRKYDHDSLHASVAYYDKPLFNVILQDGEDVAVSWDKFEQMTHTDKLRLCREEIYATALERKVIPSDYTVNPLSAYRWAMQQTITSFWKGRWALFMVLHLKDLVNPEVDYVQVHKDNSERLVLL